MIWIQWVGCATRGEAWEPADGAPFAGREREEEEEDEEQERRGPTPAGGVALSPGVPVVTDPTWLSECGSCHLAYSPGLLPKRSWTALLAGLDDHFGDVATLDPATVAKLQAYADANAADVAPYRLSASLARASAGRTPTRILDIGGLRHEHQEFPLSWVVDNPEVKSLSNCAACHRGAAEGNFDEHQVQIPGHARRDD